MIIQIRGTSGSGKSTVVKTIIDSAEWQAEYKPFRKRPWCYRCVDPDLPMLTVLGHYEIAAGGCDTLGSAPDAYKAIKEVNNGIIIAEGLLLSEDVKWTLLLAKETEVRCLFLLTPPEECLRRVCKRQETKGKPPADPERVRRKLMTRVGTIERARLRLIDAGVKCYRTPSSLAPEIIKNWIKECGP